MLPEPRKSPGWSWRIGRLAGIDVFVHGTFLLLLVWVAVTGFRESGGWSGALAGVALVSAVFGSVVAHELGHALTARRFGVTTRDIILLPIGGVARLEKIPDRPSQELAVAAAGPAVSLALAGLLAAAAAIPGAAELARINLGLALFNLLPAFPMDGGRMLRALLAWRGDYLKATQTAAKLGQTIALGLGMVGLFGNPMLVLVAAFVWFGAAAEANATEARVLLADVPVRAAMVTEFETLGPGATLGEAADRLLAGSQTDFPVVEPGGRLLGVLTRDRLVAGLAAGGPDQPAAGSLLPPPEAVGPDDSLATVARRMQDHRGGVVPVAAGGRIVGLVTLENVGEFLLLRQARPAWHRGAADPLGAVGAPKAQA